MNRISSTPNISLRREWEATIHTSLLDNWRHQDTMAQSRSVPRDVGSVYLATATTPLDFNINEDDLDCPGHDRNLPCSSSSESIRDTHLPCSSSSEGLYDSSEDDASSRARTMSIDDVVPEESEDRNRNVTFSLPRDDEQEDWDWEVDSCTPTVGTPTGRPAPAHSLGYFRLERRASFDNGVYGMSDRIVKGELGVPAGWQRKAVTAPGTPADPGTPMARYLSEEELMVQPDQVFHRIYNLLCAERVTQMTKTYNDIEAVTRLLEEKERDLELAARIGQTLLTKNKDLSSRGDTLDEQLTYANDKINQLRHDVSMKDELLKFYCQDLQDQSPGDGSPSPGMANLSKLNMEMLHRKVGTLEEENLTLRLESEQLRSDTDTYEEKEKKLVEDCLEQLVEVNQQVETFAGELRLKTEESLRQKDEITGLLVQVADLHKRVRQLTIENMDLAEKLQASRESQRQLTKELSVQQDRYDELFEMLEEAQDELRGHRNRNNPKATRHLYASAALPQATGGMDSLASELESSMQQEQLLEEERKERRARSWKVFETARAARKAASKSSHEGSVRMSTSVSDSQNPSNINSDSESFNSDGYSADMDSMYGSSTELGRPGIPGSNDLESALRRLAMRRANDINEQDFSEVRRETRSEGMTPFRIGDTPDSLTSPASGYSYLGYSNASHSSTQFKMSDKLQIVKPLEGSVTLRHWQRLAQPHLGGLFERREGVKVKGERKLDLEGEVYTLSDFEEDEDIVECLGRRFADSSTVNTFINSMVSHPSQHNLPPSSSVGLQSPPPGSQPVTSTPYSKKHSNTSSTYTMSLGLAAILQGREASSTTRSMLRPIASCPVMLADTSAAAVSGSDTPLTPSLPTVEEADTASINNPGLFGKLISTGYSLLWNKLDDPVPSTTPTSVPSNGSSPARASKAAKTLPGGASTGVLGAIATFRKNGIL